MTTLQKSLATVAIVAAVGTGIYEATQVSRLRNENQALQQQYVPLNAQIQQLQLERDAATNRLAAVQQELAQLKSGQDAGKLLKLRGEFASLRQRLVSNEASTGSLTIPKMMSDPSMKEYLRQAMVEKLKSLYAVLFDELKLAPEQKEKFLQLQADRAAQSLARLAALSGGASPSEVDHSAAHEFDASLQALLGPAGYARYNDFTGEIPARSTISLLKAQLEEQPLSEDQSARLLQVIKTEPTELTGGMSGAPDMAFLGSQSEIDRFLQRVEDCNQRILQQSASFLAPGQLQTLNTVLTNAVSTRKLTAAAFIKKP